MIYDLEGVVDLYVVILNSLLNLILSDDLCMLPVIYFEFSRSEVFSLVSSPYDVPLYETFEIPDIGREVSLLLLLNNLPE